MASPPPPVTDSSSTTTPTSEATTSSPPPPTDESSPPPQSENSSSPPPPSPESSSSSPPPSPESSSSSPPPSPENSSSAPPVSENSSSPPPSASPPPTSPPPQEQSSPPPPSSESPPPQDSSQSPPPPSESGSPPPPSSSPEPKPPTPPSNDNNNNNNNNNNNPSPNTFFPPPPSSGSPSHMPPPPTSKLAPSPPPHRRSPSYNGGSSSSSNKSDSSDSSPNVAVIAGIAAAGVVILAVIILAVMCSRKKKKRKPYYMDPGRGPPPPGGDYYHSSANPWQSPQMTDHVVKLPPPPGMMGTPVGGGGGWGAPPPPPPPGITSSEYSSGFSGPHHTSIPPPSPSVGNVGLGFSKSMFSYEELATATSGFSQANLLGQGGFGYVHKGVLPNGQVVAVKSLKSGSGQGDREFQAEVEIITRVHHRHLVSLVGYCIADSQRMLVYEFVSNSTLEFHLHGKGRPVMDFTSRMRIALGSAKGFAYLHEDCHPRIIHRDIKAANILLDDNYEAMVADFGLAKLSSDNYTHVSTRVMGTFGYLAPEYASSGKLTEKSDVFSFGVMLLELITGRRPVDLTNIMEDSLVDWARPLLQKAIEDGDYSELVDPRLEGNFTPNEMARLVSCAAASIRHSARRRPKMSQIVRALEGDASLDDLNEGGAKVGQSGMYSSNQGGDRSYDTGMYNADMMKFRKMVLDSQEMNSSEYGATSEYGLNPSSSSSESGYSGQHRQKL